MRRLRLTLGHWRAISLATIYLLMGIHVLHWKLAGRTLAPLELNELMYTLELGVITAGFVFMALVILGTLIFGRFFCSWACHILALQDLSAWILEKLRLSRPKIVRSRTLLWIPPATALYMFVWPQLKRVMAGQTAPILHLRTDSEGWASFVTEDFWRNLPGPGIALLTFFVCGFVMVYLLGTRGFCTYVCPYGAIFALMDRFAPGRIRVTEDCVQCAQCTAVCSSGVRVHEEVHRHGTIVNSSCLKDFDCVEVCPEEALYYSMGQPSLQRSFQNGGRFGLPYDFTLAEDLGLFLVFVATLFTFRGLYGLFPLLLTLALGCLYGVGTVHFYRLWDLRHLRWARHNLKTKGKVTPIGWAFTVSYLIFSAFFLHSASVRYLEFRGEMFYERSLEGTATTAAAARSVGYLRQAESLSLLSNPRVEERLWRLTRRLQLWDELQQRTNSFLKKYPSRLDLRLTLGTDLAGLGRFDEASRELGTVIRLADEPEIRATAHRALSRVLSQQERPDKALKEIERAVKVFPSSTVAWGELADLHAAAGRMEEAAAAWNAALEINPALSGALVNLGTYYAGEGAMVLAAEYFQKAAWLQPDNPTVLRLLGRAQLESGQIDKAEESLQRALALYDKDAETHYGLYLVYRNDRPNEAETFLRRAKELGWVDERGLK